MTALARFLLCLAALLLSAAAMLIFDWQPDWFFPGYRSVSQKMISCISSISGKLPFALWELLLFLLIFLFLFSIVRMIKKKKSFFRWLTGWMAVAGIGGFLFVFLWGLNHYAPPLSEELGLVVEDTSEESLISATKYYMQQAEAYAELMDRDENGDVIMPELDDMLDAAASCFTPLAETYPFFAGGSSAPVKRTYLVSTLLSYTGTTGIFVCLTGESTINPETFPVSLPFTMCHEVAHRYALAGENEANFAAFLACEASRNVYFRYSGYYNAFIYCYNALYKVSSQTALSLWSEEMESLRHDCAAANAHYEPYEGKVQDAAQKVNDTYLKAFSETSGVQSYGEVADYLIAYYLSVIS